MKKYYFIDESGDPLFYGHRKKLLVGTDGFQPYLIIGMPELSIIDYMMWALQRKLLKGESRYFDALKDKYGDVIDLYGK